MMPVMVVMTVMAMSNRNDNLCVRWSSQRRKEEKEEQAKRKFSHTLFDVGLVGGVVVFNNKYFHISKLPVFEY